MLLWRRQYQQLRLSRIDFGNWSQACESAAFGNFPTRSRTLSNRATIFLATRPDNGRNRLGYIDVERNSPAKRALFFLFAQCRCLEEFVSLLFIFSFTNGFDRFGIERPATEAIGTRVSRGPVSYGHGQGTAGIAIVPLLDQLRARRRLRIVLPKMELRPSKVQKPAGPSSG